MADLKQVIATLTAQFQDLDSRQPGEWPLTPRLLCAFGALFAELSGVPGVPALLPVRRFWLTDRVASAPAEAAARTPTMMPVSAPAEPAL